MASIYQRMRERNHCNHRDYQNLGVNGASVLSVSPINEDGTIHALRRDQRTDAPALVFFALEGNDVCRGDPGLGPMTTVPEYKTAVRQSLDLLNKTLPAGSTVITMGLAQGTLLYNTTHGHQHPIGCTYNELYGFMTCQDVTPCWGWLNNNATWRNATQTRADQLSETLSELSSESQYSHIDVHYMRLDFDFLIHEWTKRGGVLRDTVEPADGFHPSQILQQLIAENIWGWLEKEHPDALGPVNPHNADIEKLFGDQGGY
jgi:acyloxyacyl hydrolase